MMQTNELQKALSAQGFQACTTAEDFAREMKLYRLRSGLSQRDLARVTKVSRYTIMRIEKAKDVTWETMYKVFSHVISNEQTK